MKVIESFLNWYNDKFKKKPLMVLLATIIAIIAGVNTIIDGVQGISKVEAMVSSYFFEDKEIYTKLSKVNTGLNTEYIDGLFGKPSITQAMSTDINSKLSDYGERLYVGDKFFLYVVEDKNHEVLSYSITIRKPDFHPLIPLEIGSADKKEEIKNLKLGKMRLSDLQRYKPEKRFADRSSKFAYYTEQFYFGNPGFYKDYLFGYSPSGYDNLTEDHIRVINNVIDSILDGEKINPKDLDDFRNSFVPNSFAVIDQGVDDYLREVLSEGMIGANYFDAREFN